MFPHPFSSTLYEHYEAINARFFAERDALLYSLQSRSDAERYIKRVREKLNENFALPPRPAPECRTTGRFEANKVLVDKLLFRCSAERWCSAWFLRLPGTERRPAALLLCGHSDNGKFSDAYQMAAFGLARKGFGVMFVDPIGQGEMYQHRETPGLSPTDAHNYLGRLCTLDGGSLSTLFVNDAMCAIDNLMLRSEILPGPVSVTGNSGGGQMTYFLHGLDERVGFSAASCHMNTLRAIFRDETATDAESSPAGLISAGCDRPDFAIAGAPKPLLLIGQDNDFIDLRGVKKAHADIRHIYDLLGRSGNLEMRIGSGNHGFVKHGREAAYAFFTKHVMGREDASEAEDITPVPPEIGNVTPSGRVIDMENMRSLPEIFRSAWKKRRFTASLHEISSFLKKTLQLENFEAQAPDYRIMRPHTEEELQCACCRWVWNTDNTPAVAGISMFLPGSRSLIPEGRKATLAVAEESALQELRARVGADETVFALDMRGIGISESEIGISWGEYHIEMGREYFLDNSGRLMGESLAGGRVRDLLSAVALLNSCGYDDITLAGSGHAALMIAYACGAMGKIPGVSRLTLKKLPATFTEPDLSLRSTVFLSGMLQHFDLPQLYAQLQSDYQVLMEESL